MIGLVDVVPASASAGLFFPGDRVRLRAWPDGDIFTIGEMSVVGSEVCYSLIDPRSQPTPATASAGWAGFQLMIVEMATS